MLGIRISLNFYRLVRSERINSGKKTKFRCHSKKKRLTAIIRIENMKNTVKMTIFYCVVGPSSSTLQEKKKNFEIRQNVQKKIDLLSFMTQFEINFTAEDLQSDRL